MNQQRNVDSTKTKKRKRVKIFFLFFCYFTELSLVNFSYMRKFNFYSSWLTVLNVNSSLFGFLPMLMVSPLWSVPPSINSQTPSSM